MTIGFKAELRRDRTGSQFYCLISELLYSIHHCKTLYIDRKENNFLLNPLFEKIELFTGQVGLQELKAPGRRPGSPPEIRNISFTLTGEVRSDLITYAKQKLSLRVEKPSQVDFKTGQIVIHIRNGDTRNVPIHDGLKVHEYCKNLVENKNQVYNRDEMDTLGSDQQCQTSEAAIDKVLSEVCTKHPDKEVHLVSEDKDLARCKYKNISKKYNIKFFGSDINTDFYHLATADVLIGSRSTYCITALYYFNGKEFFYPYWGLYTCIGLGTKYDKTNYQPFRNI